MALNRRAFLTASLAGGLSAACATTGENPARGSRYAELGAVGPERGARGTILVCMPETAQTKEVWTGLSDELGDEFRLIAVRVEGRGGSSVIGEAMRRHRPTGLVLMNNPTVAAYSVYQRTSGAAKFPPAVIVMTSFLDGRRSQVRHATGISYEVPLITVVTNLRRLVTAPIDRIGVVVRAPLRGFVERQAVLARREQIRVSAQVIGAAPNVSELKRALRKAKEQVDALWILNDDQLLTTHFIAEGWLPGLEERPFRPVIVGAASLVSPTQSFGTFAVLPDHVALGAQAASMLYDIADDGWTLPEGEDVELPLSTTTAVDLVQVRERFALQKDALAQVDRIVE